MKMFYSPSKGAMLNDVVYGNALPADAVRIPADRVDEILIGLGLQKKLIVGQDGELILIDPPEVQVVISDALVDAERDRRIDAGVTFEGVLYQSKTTDRENIAGAAQMAFMAVVGGVQPSNLRWSNPDQDFAWICAENTLVPMDAQTVVEFGRAAALRKSELIYAGRALKDLPEIPETFTDDVWWPA